MIWYGDLARRPRMEVDAETILREAGTAITATTAETAIALDPTIYCCYNAILTSAGYTGYAAGTDQWSVAIEISDASDGTFTAIASTVITGSATQIGIPLSGFFAEYKDADAMYIRVKATKTGSPDGFDYTCFLSPE